MSEIMTGVEWGMYSADLPTGSLAGQDYARFSVTSGAVVKFTDTPAAGVALPSDATHAYIVVEDAAIRVRVATDPTTTEGVKWYADTSHPMENQRGFLVNARMIAIGATAKITVLWGRQS